MPWQIENFGEPLVCCQICNLVNFIVTQTPRFQKISLKSGNNAVICVIESYCKEKCFFFGLVSKLGYFWLNIFLFYFNLRWLAKQNISLRSMLVAVSLLYNLYGVKSICQINRDLQSINNSCVLLLTEIKTLKVVKKISFIGRATNIKKTLGNSVIQVNCSKQI